VTRKRSAAHVFAFAAECFEADLGGGLVDIVWGVVELQGAAAFGGVVVGGAVREFAIED